MKRPAREALKVKAIRVYIAPTVFRDIETRDFSVVPGQWVTKYFRLRKEVQPLLGEKATSKSLLKPFPSSFIRGNVSFTDLFEISILMVSKKVHCVLRASSRLGGRAFYETIKFYPFFIPTSFRS